MKRRILALLMAVVLFGSLGDLPALAASSPSLAWEEGDGRGELVLTLHGLDGSGIYAAQLELELEGNWPDADFAPGGRDLYSVCRTEEGRSSTGLTVYLSSRSEPLGSGERLLLGTLDLGSRGSGEDVLPAYAQLTLLGRGLNRIEDLSGRIRVQGISNSSGSSGGDREDKKDRDPAPKPEPAEPDAPPEEIAPPAATPFADVRESDWFYTAVRYVFEKGLMNGTAADRFSPDEPTTRGMIVTILHRMEGAPEAPAPAFPDVRADFYYAQPVAWAAAHGIVTGYEDGNFGPEDNITREQLAAILYRYARYKGWDLTASASLERFPDERRISPYAVEAVSWTVGAGLIAGMANGMLSPGGTATRAEVATILMRLEAVAQRGE